MSDEGSSGPAAGPRRDVIKRSKTELAATAKLGATGLASAAGLSIARSAHAAGDDTLKIALIGCGARGSGAANQALSTAGNVKLIAMADVFADQIELAYNALVGERKDRIDVPRERKFVGFDAYQKALDAGADLVILATPPGFRAMHFEAAVKAGKHVFMEKPVAVDSAGVRTVLAAAEESKKKGLAVGVGLQRRHQNSYLETVKRLQDGAIGDFVYARVYWNGQGVTVKPRRPDDTEMAYQLHSWYFFDWLCGGNIVEQHIHNLDVINWVKGSYPVRASGMGGRQVRTDKVFGQMFDHHAVEFEYDDGTRMISQCRHIPHTWDVVSEHIAGTKGTCDVSGAKIEGDHPWSYVGPKPNPFQVEHDDLQASIRSGNPINEAERGAKSSMTAILGRLATYSGQIVSWDDALASQVRLTPVNQTWAIDAPPPVIPDAGGFYPIAVPGVTRVI